MTDDALTLEQQRILAGLCTRCGKPSRDDANLCLSCTQAATGHMKSMRARRREQGQCADCGRRSERYRCRRCYRAKRRRDVGVSAPAMGVEQPAPAMAVKLEADSKYGTRVRQRYVGRGARGAPSKEQLEQDDIRTLRFALREVEKAIAELAGCAGPEVQALPRIQREVARKLALAPANLASRLIDEVLDRNHYNSEAQDRLAARNRPR